MILGSRRALCFVGSDPTILLVLTPRPVSDCAWVRIRRDHLAVAPQCCDNAQVHIVTIARQEVGAHMHPSEQCVIIAGCDAGDQPIQPGVSGFGRLRFSRFLSAIESSRHPLTRPFLRGLWFSFPHGSRRCGHGVPSARSGVPGSVLQRSANWLPLTPIFL